MTTKIKLEVNHAKHKKNTKQSGAKLTIKQPENTKVNEDLKDQENVQQQKIDKPNKLTKSKSKKKNEQNSPNIKEKNNKQKDSQQKQKQSDRQFQTIQRIKEQQQKTRKTIQQLIIQYKDAADDIFTNHGHNPDKQQKIQLQLQKLQKQHTARLEKLKKIEKKSIDKQQTKKKQQEQKINARSQKAKQKRRKRAENKLQQLKSLSQQRLERQASFQEFYENDYKKRVPMHIKLEKEYQKKREEMILEQKDKLKQIKRKFVPIDHDELNEFQDHYNQNKWNLLEQYEKKREQQNEAIEQINADIKAKLWKGQCHKRVKEELQSRQKLKNEARTKLEKTKEYGTIVKSQFKPKINHDNRNMSLNLAKVLHQQTQSEEETNGSRTKHRYKKVAHEKYFQGKNQGLIIEKIRKSLDHNQKVQKGNSYLEYVVNLPKNQNKRSLSVDLEKQSILQPIQKRKTPSTTFKPKRVKNPYYSNSNSYSEKLPSKGDIDKIRNPQAFNFLIADMRGKQKQMQLEERAIKYGQYNGILDLQSRHNILNKKMIQGINQKLQILSRI